MKTRLLVLCVCAAVAASPRPASAGFQLVTSRAAVTTPDTLDWATLGGSGTVVPAGASVTSAGGRAASLPQGAFLLDVGFSQGFNAGFDIGQIVIYTGAGSDIVFRFADPVSAAGAQVWGVSSAAAITLTALDAAGNSIAGSSVTPAIGGGGGNVSFGNAGFVGLQGTAGSTFYGLRFSTSPQAYAINYASFTPAAVQPSGVAAPLPPTLLAGAFGAFGLVGAARRRG